MGAVLFHSSNRQNQSAAYGRPGRLHRRPGKLIKLAIANHWVCGAA
ncbi:hypothetical protein AAF134_14915 [Synechococcus lacustris Tous-12m]